MSEQLSKMEDRDDLSFDRTIFQSTFNGYVRKLGRILLLLVLLVCAPFITYLIAKYLELTGIDMTGFLGFWHATVDRLRFWGWLPDLTYKLISSGIVSVGGFSCGVISIGWYCSCGVISIGGFGSCGIISISSMFSAGVVTFSPDRAYGLIAIAIGHKVPFEDAYTHGKAVGVIAIGRVARGVYGLSYKSEGEGVYQFSPKRQDPEAVALFTQWFRKFLNCSPSAK